MNNLALDLMGMQALVSRCPFNRVLNLQVAFVAPGRISLILPWKEDLLSSPEQRLVHGGVLAALVDVSCGYALASILGHASPTVDLVIDYHRSAVEGDLTADAVVSKSGRNLAIAHCTIKDTDNRIVATGRGVFYSALSTSTVQPDSPK